MPSFQNLRIIFFGTPHFAVASLAALVEAGANVIAVVTAPDRPAGRGRQICMTPIKEYAAAKNIPVLQPPKLKDEDFLNTLGALRADLQVVVAFRMLPQAVWSMPPLGTINVHASLLPQYRGAAPINWAIINGEAETGVTTFRLKQAIDTGDLLMQSRVAILPSDNAGALHDKLMEAGANLLIATLDAIAAGGIQPQAQAEVPGLKHAPKIFKEDTRIQWDKPAADIHNFVRGLSPNPGAFTTVKDISLRIFQTHYEPESSLPHPGTVETDSKKFLRIAAADGWVYANEVQAEGKKRMNIADFLRGFRM